MSDEKLIRLENFRRLVQGRQYKIRDLIDRGGRSYTFWRELQLGERSFGEKLARSLEESFQLPRNWLDRIDPVVPPEGAVAPLDDSLRLTAEFLALLADVTEEARVAALKAAIDAVVKVKTDSDARQAEAARRSAAQALDQAQLDAESQAKRRPSGGPSGRHPPGKKS